MLKRIISAIIMIAYALLTLWFGGIWTKIFVLTITLFGSYEFWKAFKTSGKNPMVLPLVILFLPTILSFFASKFDPGVIMIEGLTGSFNYYPVIFFASLVSVMFIFVFKHKKHTFEDGSISFFGGFYITLTYNVIISLREFDATNGFWIVLLPLVGSVMCDTFALFSGMLFGKKKLCPEISPNKTIAGSVGGSLASVLFCCIYILILNALNIKIGISIISALILGAIYALVSQVGDLFASAIKRECNVKDFGNLIPGHGGALDRVDSYGIAFLITYFYLIIF